MNTSVGVTASRQENETKVKSKKLQISCDKHKRKSKLNVIEEFANVGFLIFHDGGQTIDQSRDSFTTCLLKSTISMELQRLIVINAFDSHILVSSSSSFLSHQRIPLNDRMESTYPCIRDSFYNIR